jgi:hypothetical protein
VVKFPVHFHPPVLMDDDASSRGHVMSPSQSSGRRSSSLVFREACIDHREPAHDVLESHRLAAAPFPRLFIAPHGVAYSIAPMG